MTKTIATIDQKTVLEIYLEIKNILEKYGERFLYFLAACQYLDPDIDLETTLKLIPYGRLIGIDNSPLNKNFKSFKILRAQAILHDASGFIAEYSHFVFGSYHGVGSLFFCESVQKQFAHFCSNAVTRNSDTGI